MAGLEVFSVAFMLMGSAEASPWVKDAGGAYLKAGYSRFDAAEFIQPDGQDVEDAIFKGQSAGLYGEVGVGRSLQVVFDLPYTHARNLVGESTFANRRFGDLTAGLEVGNLSSTLPLSLAFQAKVPLYDNARFAGQKNEALYPALGDGQLDLTALLATGSGVSVGPLRGWVSAEAGLRHRTEIWLGDSSSPNRKHVDGIPFNLQVGWSPSVKETSLGWLTASVSGVKNLAFDESTREFVQFNGGGAVKVGKGFAIEAGYGQMLWARNSARGGGLNVGLSWSRDGRPRPTE